MKTLRDFQAHSINKAMMSMLKGGYAEEEAEACGSLSEYSCTLLSH